MKEPSRQVHPKERCWECHNRYHGVPREMFLSVMAIIPFKYEKMVVHTLFSKFRYFFLC